MKKIMLGLIVATLAFPVFADEAEYLSICKGYAKEDGVSKEEMAEYLQTCVEDLKSAEADKKS